MSEDLSVCVASQTIRLFKNVNLMIGVLQSPCCTKAGTSAANNGDALLL